MFTLNNNEFVYVRGSNPQSGLRPVIYGAPVEIRAELRAGAPGIDPKTGRQQAKSPYETFVGEDFGAADVVVEEAPEEVLPDRAEVIAECEALRREAEEEARIIREKARKWADGLVHQTERETTEQRAACATECERLREETEKSAYDEGYARGMDEGDTRGYDEGYTKGLKKCRATLEELMAALAAVPAEKDRILRENERQLFDLIFSISNKVTGHCLQQKDKAAIQRVLREKAKAFRNSAEIKVTLSKLDVDIMGEADFDALREIFRDNQHIEFEVVKDAPHGTLILDNGREITDASVATQLEMIEKLGAGKFRDKPEERFRDNYAYGSTD